MNKIKSLIGKAAPLLSGLLGGPVGNAAKRLIAGALGTDDSEDAIIRELEGNPDAIVRVRELESQERVRLRELTLESEKARLKHDSGIAAGQAAINLEDAKSKNWFQSGWRPACGWIGVAGLGYHFVVYELLVWAMAIWLPEVTPPPDSDVGELLALMTPLLGLGAYRSYEKKNRVA